MEKTDALVIRLAGGWLGRNSGARVSKAFRIWGDGRVLSTAHSPRKQA